MNEAIVIRVEGMGCQSCVAAVEKATKDITHEARVEVDLAGGLVRIENSAVARDALAAAIRRAGYYVVG